MQAHSRAAFFVDRSDETGVLRHHQQPPIEDYPKVSEYTFSHDGTTIRYTLAVQDILGTLNAYVHAPDQVKAMFDKMGKSPSYGRYHALGDLVIQNPDGTTIERSGDLIYEFVYSGVSYREYV